jgi:hypothetical protein
MAADLPQEIWIHIFRFATSDVYDQFSTSRRSPFSQRRLEKIGPDVSLLSVKESLSQVCQAWRRLALELLFEFLDIDFHAVPQLNYQCDLTKTAPNAVGTPLQFVRHLTIGYSAYSAFAASQEPLFYSLKLVCSNMHVFSNLAADTHKASTGPAGQFLNSLLTERGQSLRYLEFAPSCYLPTSILQHLSALAPRLEVLHFDAIIRDNFNPNTLTLPSLHTLVVNYSDFEYEIVWDLPHLEHLEYWGDSDVFQSQMESGNCPPQIQTLDLRYCAIPVKAVLRCFATLEVLLLRCHPGTSWAEVDSGHLRALRQIGLQFRADIHKSELDAAFTALTNRTIFPSVTHIYCLDFRSCWNTEYIDWWRAWMERTRSLSIQVEDPFSKGPLPT